MRGGVGHGGGRQQTFIEPLTYFAVTVIRDAPFFQFDYHLSCVLVLSLVIWGKCRRWKIPQSLLEIILMFGLHRE